MLTDIGFPAYDGVRSPIVESAFEYGSRCGVWRLLRIFDRFGVQVSVLGVVRALSAIPRSRAPSSTTATRSSAMASAGSTITACREATSASTSPWRSRAHAADRHPPVGWFNGRPSPNTRRLLVEHGGFLYDRDSLNDELPYWVEVGGRHHLVVPYSFETNDNRFDGTTASATPTISSPT